jgi:hypothetical protein
MIYRTRGEHVSHYATNAVFFFIRVRVTRSLVFCVVFCRFVLVLLSFFLLVILLSVIFRPRASDYLFGIFKRFYITERDIKRSGSSPSIIGSPIQFWLSCLDPMVYFLPRRFELFGFPIFLLLTYLMKVISWNVLSVLNTIYTFSLNIFTLYIILLGILFSKLILYCMILYATVALLHLRAEI